MSIKKWMVDELELYKNIMKNCYKYDKDMEYSIDFRWIIIRNIEEHLKYWGLPKYKESIYDEITPDEVIYRYFEKMNMLLKEYYKNIGFIE